MMMFHTHKKKEETKIHVEKKAEMFNNDVIYMERERFKSSLNRRRGK